MITTELKIEKYCDDCPYFSTETTHVTNHDNFHIVYVTCENKNICDYLYNKAKKGLINENM